MSKRFMVSVSDEFYSWLSSEAESLGIGVATLSTILFNEAKRSRDTQANFQAMIQKLQMLNPEQWQELVNSELKLNPPSE